MPSSRPSTPRKAARLCISFAVLALASPAVAAATIEDRLAAVEKRLGEPTKDFWDKLDAASGLVSGIMVALIGFYATGIYNKRQKAAEERRRDQEVLIAQIQTVEKYLPYLSGTDEAAKSAALVAISLLGNDELAVRLAESLRSPGSINALTTIAARAGAQDPAVPDRARAALSHSLSPLRGRVVRLFADSRPRATGFIVSSDGWVVTAAHAVQDEPDGIALYLDSDDGAPPQVFPARILALDRTRDLALLLAELEEPLAAADIEPASPVAGETITALQMVRDGDLYLAFGTVIGFTDNGLISGVRSIIASLPTEPGASGAPVVNGEGRLIGLIQGRDDKGNAYLIDAAEIFAFVKEQRAELSAR